MVRARLDSRDTFPSGMEEYLAQNGWHFSKRMYEWAAANMRKRSVTGKPEKVPSFTKEELTNLLTKNNVHLDNDCGYDAVYVANMCRADYFGSSIVDEAHLAKYVKDTIDDFDAYDGMVFTRFYADCIGSGNPIPWDDVI